MNTASLKTITKRLCYERILPWINKGFLHSFYSYDKATSVSKITLSFQISVLDVLNQCMDL